MILVVLGTQDKDFSRLLKAVDKEIENGTIKDKVIVQAGQTKYESSNMEIFDLIPAPEFEKLLDKADLIITHGGAGSILSAIKKGKKVIAAARLSKYGEHHNDHQKQIIKEFSDLGYILELRDFKKLGKIIEKSKTFKPKKFESNTKNMVKLLQDYMEEDNHVSWYNKIHSNFNYGLLLGIISVILFVFLNTFKINIYISSIISYIMAVFLCYLLFRKKSIMMLVYLVLEVLFLFLLMNYLNINTLISKIICSLLLIVISSFINIFSFNE